MEQITANLKTRTLMKIFMRTEYNNSEKIGQLTMSSYNLNQAKILQELKDHQKEISARMKQNLKINIIETLPELCGQMKNEENISRQKEMN